ncbi:pectinesterase-like [Eucalyptus grandis]|uniref:pectinesterase-like n=1 Tax=Eucalyptus grandis TaxID=71139 RepID=UPI00192EBEE4|nr:pectinesterase-like [Eucalyptus grandis]
MSTSKVHPMVIFLFLSLLPNLIPAKNPNSQLQVTHSRCRGTPYSDLCVSTLASFTGLASMSFPEIISGMLHQSASEVRAASTHCTVMKNHFLGKLSMLERQALDICLELFRDIFDDFDNAVSYLESSKVTVRHYYDLQSLLSGMMTNVYTCTDEFDPHTDNLNLGDSMKDRLSNILRHVSNSLFLLAKIRGVNNPSGHGIRERFPAWMSLEDSLLVQTPTNATKFDLVVAKDGSGNFTSINDAVAAAPDNIKTRFVIYIKEGDYLEYVTVNKTKTNLMFVGDGIEKTLIKGNRNYDDGWTAYWSATVAIEGDGFLAKGITFENFAGPKKGQAAAFRSRSDKSAFFQCNFSSYQDTMYVHSHRQFYRDCDIYGTIDFIFGDAAVVFQNCNLYARKPNEGQANVFTAQGREDPLGQTGMSFLGCNFAAAPDLAPVQSSFKTFLGRPWKEFSRTVIMESYIGDLVDPAGWSEFHGSAGLRTLFYGEYQNRGPGSNMSDRVKWPGYKVITSSTVAKQFTVESFIQGNQWLNNTGFPYFSGLD